MQGMKLIQYIACTSVWDNYMYEKEIKQLLLEPSSITLREDIQSKMMNLEADVIQFWVRESLAMVKLGLTSYWGLCVIFVSRNVKLMFDKQALIMKQLTVFRDWYLITARAHVDFVGKIVKNIV